MSKHGKKNLHCPEWPLDSQEMPGRPCLPLKSSGFSTCFVCKVRRTRGFPRRTRAARWSPQVVNESIRLISGRPAGSPISTARRSAAERPVDAGVMRPVARSFEGHDLVCVVLCCVVCFAVFLRCVLLLAKIGSCFQAGRTVFCYFPNPQLKVERLARWLVFAIHSTAALWYSRVVPDLIPRPLSSCPIMTHDPWNLLLMARPARATGTIILAV